MTSRSSHTQAQAPIAHADHHNHSPVRLQYLAVKRQHPDALLFFRMGDFFELFDEDAEIVARELELALTRRDWGRGEKTPMAGVPHHAAEGYIARLIAKGYRVAVCEQVSDPALSKGLVEREVLRVVTPGTVVDPAMLAAKRNNYLAAAVLGRDAVGLAYADVTTGELACTQIAAPRGADGRPDPDLAVAQEIARLQPAELLVEAAADAEPPLRLCYLAGLYRAVRSGRGQMREFVQAGVELIGAPAPAGTVEV
ncbi:MAG TPA: ATP phosphoribosyltransferase regulatory subunit, partial [Ktedonobacterales bacterium]|nr:ATP phosphoribosyltransferase regulatory subunit [Ktedonobacterales bacterium]